MAKYDYGGVCPCGLKYNCDCTLTASELIEREHSQLIKKSAFDTQVGGNHYKDMTIQPLEFILANGLGFCEGSVVKYICRYKKKGGIEDLRKVRHYVDLLIEHEEKEMK